MTTKMRRGRDPEQHVVHAGVAEANRFRGSHGELSFVASGDDTGPGPRAIIQARLHNGLDAGGYVVPAVPASNPESLLPVARVYPEVPFTVAGEGQTTIEHGLGYTPIVQVLTMAGEALDTWPNLTITHSAGSLLIENTGETEFNGTLLLR